MGKSLLAELGTVYASSNHHVVTRSATQDEIREKLYGKRAVNTPELGPGQRVVRPGETRFAQTTQNVERASTLSEAFDLFASTLSNSPIIKSIGADTSSQRKRKHRNTKSNNLRVKVGFTKEFQEEIGVSSVEAAITLNSNAIPNLVNQSEAVITFDPNAHAEYSEAAMYADLLAHLGVWETWLELFEPEDVIEVRRAEYGYPSAEEILLEKERQKILLSVKRLLGQPIIALLEKQTRIIEKNRGKILHILENRSSHAETLQKHSHRESTNNSQTAEPKPPQKQSYVNKSHKRKIAFKAMSRGY